MGIYLNKDIDLNYNYALIVKSNKNAEKIVN
jgi:hypothetical protein